MKTTVKNTAAKKNVTVDSFSGSFRARKIEEIRSAAIDALKNNEKLSRNFRAKIERASHGDENQINFLLFAEEMKLHDVAISKLWEGYISTAKRIKNLECEGNMRVSSKGKKEKRRGYSGNSASLAELLAAAEEGEIGRISSEWTQWEEFVDAGKLYVSTLRAKANAEKMRQDLGVKY